MKNTEVDGAPSLQEEGYLLPVAPGWGLRLVGKEASSPCPVMTSLEAMIPAVVNPALVQGPVTRCAPETTPTCKRGYEIKVMLSLSGPRLNSGCLPSHFSVVPPRQTRQ